MSLNDSGKNRSPKNKWWFVITVIAITLILLRAGKSALDYTSTDKYCMSCHIHPGSDQNWRLSTHYNNSSGSITGCSECHLPPKGEGYIFAKARHGLKDLYGYLFKDSSEINWEAKNLVDNAKHFVYEGSCIRCHENLFPVTLSVDGSNAHYFYTTSQEPLACINCHLNVGHYDRNAIHAHDSAFGVTKTAALVTFTEPALIERFENFSEKIPGTSVSFKMIAIPGGTFEMGSPETEPLRDNDEGPVRKVTLSQFLDGQKRK